MPWFFVDDGFSDSKPVLALPDRHRLAACGLWVLAGAWSAKEETDGFVPSSKLFQLRARTPIIEALTESGESLSPLWSKVSGGIQFNNWAKWQKTRAENEARRKREAEKKQTWRAAKKGRDYVPASDDSELSTGDNFGDIEDDSNGMSTGDTLGESRYPDPTRPDPTPLVVTKEGKVTSVDAQEARPQCRKHPNENPTGITCYACMKRREWDEKHGVDAEADELNRKRAAKAAATKAMRECGLCDDDGWVLGSDGTPVEPALRCRAHEVQQEAGA